MTTQARCSQCQHDHGRYQLCRVAGRVAGGGYRRTCAQFVQRIEPPTTQPRPVDPVARLYLLAAALAVVRHVPN